MKKIITLIVLAIFTISSFAQDLVITGVFDGPLSGGTPKGVELYVINDIADLSVYGIGSANNGGGTDGEEFTFPADSYTAGDFIYVATEVPQFTAFFGFAPTYTDGSMAINGDDAVELFMSGVVVDVFGDINTDGTGTAWDHVDGWAYRNDNTGPDGSSWTVANWNFSGTDVFDGETSNGTAATPFPIGTFTYTVTPPAPDAPTFSPVAGTYATAQDVTISTTTVGADIYYTLDGNDPDNTSTPYTGPVNIAATSTLKAVAYDGSNYSTVTAGDYTITVTPPPTVPVSSTGIIIAGLLIAAVLVIRKGRLF